MPKRLFFGKVFFAILGGLMMDEQNQFDPTASEQDPVSSGQNGDNISNTPPADQLAGQLAEQDQTQSQPQGKQPSVGQISAWPSYQNAQQNGQGTPTGQGASVLSAVTPVTAPAKKQTKSVSWLTVLICFALCGITVFLCAAMMLVMLFSSSDPGNTVIYQNTTVVENTGAVITDEQTVEAVNRCKDSVVEIQTAISKSAYDSDKLLGSGSGVVWSTGDFSYIVTNNHVVDGGSYFMVTFANGETAEGRLVGTDLYSDLAVLEIEKSELSAVKPSSNAEVKEGMTVLAIGNPLGELGGSKTFGKISTSAREVTIEGITMTLIQHDAAVNAGNSGGGLFDIQGRLVGIVNAKYSGDGIYGLNFAIPIDTVKDVIGQIIEKGYVSGRPQLGVTILQYRSEYSYTKAEMESNYPGISTHLVHSGLYVVTVDPGNNFKFGDRIYEMDGQKIESMDDIRQVLAKHKPGDVIQVKVLRDGYLQQVGPYEQYMYIDHTFDFALTERTS